MWHKTFSDRLASWSDLRRQCETLNTDATLTAINSWWFSSPWTGYHLHWDDQADWPDPWQLLDDNIFCEVARGLGILYTITMLDRPDLQDAVLAEVDSDNLVLVPQKKYILNWDAEQVVNINPGPYKVYHSVSQQEIKQQIR